MNENDNKMYKNLWDAVKIVNYWKRNVKSMMSVSTLKNQTKNRKRNPK